METSTSEDDYIHNLLKSFNTNYEVLSSNFSTNEDFSFVIRTQLPKTESSSHSCDLWKESFGKATHTSWIVKETFPSPIDYSYRKIFQCQHSSLYKSKTHSKDPLYTKYRDKKCTASIDIKIQKVTKDTAKKHRHIREGRTATVKVSYQHTHLVMNAEAFGYLRMTKEVEEIFKEYFENGMTPAAAKNFHEINLMEQNTDLGDLMRTLADAQLNPTNAQVYGLYNKHREKNFGGRNRHSVLEKLKEKKKEFEKLGIEMLVQEEPLCVALITPLMRRALDLHGISDIVFVDSSGSCDQTATVTTFLYGVTKVGGLPLAVVFHTGQSVENYTAAFTLLKSLLGPDAFDKQGFPSVIMTDDAKAERTALHSVFPSSTLLLCAFHMMQALWRWLWDSKHKIKKEDRPHLMQLVRKIMYAPSESEFQSECHNFLTDEIAQKYEKYVSHDQSLIVRCKEWCYCYRVSLTTRGNNTNNIVESSIRIFKDCILLRCKSFNMIALLHFVCLNLEQYHIRRLLSFASSRRSQPQLVYNALGRKAKNLIAVKLNDNHYQVESSKDSTLLYDIYTDLEQCSCIEGIGGKFCKHLCAVQIQHQLKFINCPELSNQDKRDMVVLALGENSENLEFYNSMENTTTCTAESTANSSQTEEHHQMIDTSDHDVAGTQENINNSDGNVVENAKKIEIAKLEQHLKRFSELATSSSVQNIKKLCSKLEKVQTPSQFDDFCQSKFTIASKGSYIPVQPTSISRRKKRPGLSSGALRIQAGRPSLEEYCPTTKKCKRNLSLSIKENRTNAKSHGKGH